MHFKIIIIRTLKKKISSYSENGTHLKIRPQVGSMTSASFSSSWRRPGCSRCILSRYLYASAVSRGRRCVGQVSKRATGCLVQRRRTMGRRTGR